MCVIEAFIVTCEHALLSKNYGNPCAVVVFMSEEYTSISAFMQECIRTPGVRVV